MSKLKPKSKPGRSPKPGRPPVFVHLLPALIPAGALVGGVAVVVDALRATTSMIHALAAGADAVIPCLEIEEARRIARGLPEGTAVLAGEREGVAIEGFDLGNSPASFTPEAVSGKSVVMTTTNGTRAILASTTAERVLVAGFVNLGATVEALQVDGRPVHLVCAGTDGEVSLEDTLMVGAIAQALDSWGWDHHDDGHGDHGDGLLANDAGEVAASLWREAAILLEDGYPLAEALADGRGGRRVAALGLSADIDDASVLDRFAFAAELLRDPFRIVPAGDGTGPRLRLFGAT